ncbi:MAG TPA: flagellar export protein FliJ [Chloroflexota bacterium]|nr:flagellar export protein FliJ [Chloroflexota bacterium]
MTQPFRLASVLDFREAQLSMAVQDLARAETAVQSIENTLHELEQDQYSVLGQSTSWKERPAADLRLIADYLDVLQQHQQSLEAALVTLREHMAQARAVVVERHRGVDILNRLKERQMSIVRQEEARQEQRAIDEVNSTRSIEKSRQEDEEC